SHVSTAGGGECSSTAIRALIKKLVSAENPKKPLSDSRIAELLEEQGINVARRTIAKYRESLNIPPSNERQRLICSPVQSGDAALPGHAASSRMPCKQKTGKTDATEHHPSS